MNERRRIAQMGRALWTRGNATAVVLVSVAIFAGLLLWQRFAVEHPCTLDDAFIAFRYAHNFAVGRGLVFNAGEHVWGYTSPLHVVWLGMCGALNLPVPTLAVAGSIVFGCTAVVLIQQLLSRLVPPWLALGVGLLCLANGTAFAFCGLETSLLLALEGLFLLIHATRRGALVALVASLACLARPDALLLVGPVLIASKQARNVRSVATFATPGILWLAFAWGYYGDWLPQSFRAKGGAQSMGASLTDLAVHLNRLPFRWLGLESLLETTWGLVVASLLNVAVTLAAVLVVREQRGRALLYAVIGFPWVLIGAYGVISPPAGHYWEVHSALFFNQLGLALGVVALAQQAVIRLGRRRAALAKVCALGLAASGLVLAAVGLKEQLGGPAREQQERYMGARHRAYVGVSEWLERNAPKGSTVALQEPGTIAVLTDLHIVDLGGIVTRAGKQPDYVLVPGRVLTLGSWQSPWRVGYTQVSFFSTDGYMPLSLLMREGASIGST